MKPLLINQQNSTRIIVFSDLHISKFTGFFNEQAFINGIMNIAEELKAFPDTILLNLGDITDSGTYEDYLYAKSLIHGSFVTHGIKNPAIYYVPGNHDFRNIGMEIWRELYGFRHFLIDTTTKGGNVVILGIDSVEPDMDSGRIGDKGIDRIRKTFALFPDDTVKILCFHHHMFPVPHTGRERSTILDAGDVLPVLWESNVDIVIVGHRHYPHCSTISNGKRRMLLINNGTFSAYKTRGKAGHVYLSVEISNMEIKAEFKGIDKYSTFQQPVKHQYPLERGNIPAYPIDENYEKILTKIVQLSCTHFNRGGDFQQEIYEKGMKMILDENPDLIVHCGNVTSDANVEDYDRAKKYLGELHELKIPLLVVPGTRDLHPLGKKLWIEQIGSLDPTLDLNEQQIYIYGINTGPEPDGHVGRSHLNILSESLAKYGNKRLFIVAMHHSCLPVPDSSFERALRDAGDVINYFTGKKIPIILSGFEHSAMSLQVEKTVFVNSGCFSSRKYKSKKRNTYNLITIYSNGCLKIEEIEIHSSKRHPLGSYQVWLPDSRI